MAKLFQPEQVQLSNGIPVVLQHYEGTVASTHWWVKTGSADESPREAGFAHFLEHMLFKDAAAKETGRASSGKMARAIESLGGDINAYTSFDQTVYHVTCASEHWEKVIESFGTIAKPQRFLKTDFVREREVILEELRKNEDSPGRQLFQTLFGLTYRKHPYGRPVIGYAKTLKSATVNELEAFYRRNYVSEKMGLVLVGPIEDKTGARRKSILRLLERRFGGAAIPRRPAKAFTRPSEPAHRLGASFVSKHFDVKTPSVSLSFRVPELLHPDIPALDLLSSILGMGELSRLYQRLFYQLAIATDVSGGLYVPRDPGMLFFEAEVQSVDKVPAAIEEMLQEANRLRNEGPAADELARVVANAESERLYATQTADGMAGRLGFLRFVLGNLDFDQLYLGQLRAISSEGVREIARQYLDVSRLSGVALLPKDAPAVDAAALVESATKILPPPAAAKPVRPGKALGTRESGGAPELVRRPSGIRVAYFHRPQSHVFSVHASVLGGLRLELANPVESAEADWGASHLLSLTWTKGTSRLSAREIAGIVEGRAASFDGFSGRNSIGLQMTGLGRDWAALSDVFTETLLDCTFPEEEIEHSRRVAEDSIRSIEDHSAQLASRLFLENLFEVHPYGKLTYGSLHSIHQMRQEKLAAFHRRWLRPDRLVVSVSGSISQPAIDAWLTELERRCDLFARQTARVALPDRLPPEPMLKAPRWVERHLGREQAHMIVGGLGTTVSSEDRHALRLLQTILGGQSGRLFIELREKKSLAYSVAPLNFEGLETGYVGTYIASAPEKRNEAVEGIRKVLETLAERGPTAREMERAKEFYLGRRAMDLQSDSALAAHHGLEVLYNDRHTREDEIVKKIRGIRARDVQKACHEYLVRPHMVTSVVG